MSTFLDTNVLIYAQGTDSKSDIARQAISPDAVISVQVLNEFSNVLNRKHGLGWELVAQRVAKLREPLILFSHWMPQRTRKRFPSLNRMDSDSMTA